jgi:hypothetical protein
VSRATFVALVAVSSSISLIAEHRRLRRATAASRDPLAYAWGTPISAAAPDQYVPDPARFLQAPYGCPLRCDGVPKVGNGGATQGIEGHMTRVLERTARLSYAFVMMNYAAVAGLISLIRRDPLWRS